VITKEKEENAYAKRKREERCKGFEDTGS